MSNTRLDNLSQHMASIPSNANAYGNTMGDLIPEEMQAHLQILDELKRAKQYIKEVEEREKAILEENEKLKKQLVEAKEAAENLPDDHRALKVDNGQLQHQVKFYKNLWSDAEDRGSKYHQKWEDVLKRVTVSEDKDKRIAALELELEQQKGIISKLLRENKSREVIFDSLSEKQTKALEEKDVKLKAMEQLVQETEARYQVLELESDGFEQAYNELVQRLEAENGNCAAALNKALDCIRLAEKQQNAAASEAAILRRYYGYCYRVIMVFQDIFQKLLNADEQTVEWLPDNLQYCINAAQMECEAFDWVHEAIKSEGFEPCGVREQLAGLALSANRMQDSLQVIAEDVKQFLSALRQKPDLFGMMRNKFGKPSGK